MVSGRTLAKVARCVMAGRFRAGSCPVCAGRTVFLKLDPWLRDYYYCVRCLSIPRQRALIQVLSTLFPRYRAMAMHESSPSGAASRKLQRECPQYTPTQYFRDVAPGERKEGVRCENLEKMTFEDESFDLVITQDVMEHVLNPGNAFSEIARTLRQGGAHVFTVPYYPGQDTVVRAEESREGVTFLEEPVYHANPIDEQGSLVVTDWGRDLPDFIRRHSGMTTSIHTLFDPSRGLEGAFLDVFVSRKA